MTVHVKENKLSPLLKYPGGKDKELKYILPNIPKEAKNYYEPFVGGGAVYFAIESEQSFINDKSSELLGLYQMIKEQNTEFFDLLKKLDAFWGSMSEIVQMHGKKWLRIYKQYKNGKLPKEKLEKTISNFINRQKRSWEEALMQCLPVSYENFSMEVKKSFRNKFVRMARLESRKGNLSKEDRLENLECAFRTGFYMHIRYLYNHIEELQITLPLATAIYFFMREFCYSSMFRYNAEGKFNVPYGGISYNKKSLAKKIAYFESQELIRQLAITTLSNEDFEVFFEQHKPGEEDFVFLDPPYDSEFSTYAGNEFDQEDQKRLAEYLLTKCTANFMLIIKNTDYILSLYPQGRKTANGKQIYVSRFEKKYVVNFQARNEKDVEHLLITNYPIGQ